MAVGRMIDHGFVCQFPPTVVRATFNPPRPETLKPDAQLIAWIGQRGRWFAQWPLEDEDTTLFVGQWAWSPVDESAPPEEHGGYCRIDPQFPFVWVPSEDLVDVEQPLAVPVPVGPEED